MSKYGKKKRRAIEKTEEQPVVVAKKQVTKPAIKKNPPLLVKPGTHDIVPLILILLYVATGLVPTFGAFDIMGSQWFYLSLLNILALFFILWKKNSFGEASRKVISSVFFLLYAALFLIAGISIFSAINREESIVNYARLANCITAFLVVAILLFNRLHLLRIVAQLIAIILFVECGKILIEFFKGLGTVPITQLILNLKGNAANKNILAASLVIKIPFALYVLNDSKIVGKLFNGVTIGLAALSVFFINSRAAYLSIILLILLYTFYCFLLYRKKELGASAALTRLAFIVVPIVFSFMFSEMVLKNATNPGDAPMATTYGSVSQRLASISMTAEGSDSRSFLWGNAVDFIKKNPFMGCGIGNWKLACIPYDRSYYDDFLISYHVHNDFLEVAAESGIIAGLLFMGLFIGLGIYALRSWLSDASTDIKNVTAFSFMALAVYFVDAALNFPSERPVMQSFFVLIAALILNAWLASRKKPETDKARKNNLITLPLVFFFLVSVGAAWVCRQVYKSLVVQNFVNNDLSGEKPTGTSEQYLNAFPPLPTLNSQGLPMDLLRAKYLMKDKRYAEALDYLAKSKKANPYLGYDELIRARVYNAENKTDSAYAAVKRAFNTKPRSRSTFVLLSNLGAAKKDTLGIQQHFEMVNTLRRDPWTWNVYIRAMGNAGYSIKPLNALIDSAQKLWPKDTALQTTRTLIPYLPNSQPQTQTTTPNNNQNNTGTGIQQPAPAEDAVAIFNRGNMAYGKQDYKAAINYFLKYCSLVPADYLGYEAAGLSYFSLKDYNNAIRYLKQSAGKNNARDGKSEYYIAQSYLSLDNKEQACIYLKLADQKNYRDAKLFMDTSCK